MSNLGRNLPPMSREDIQTVDDALNDLRDAVHAPRGDQRRPDAAVALRRAGFTTPQIVALSHGHLTRQSVDRWVEGAAMPAGGPAERAVEIIAEGVTRNQTLDQMIAGLTVQVQFAAAGASIDDLLAFHKQLQEEHILLSEFIEHYKIMKAIGLQFANVKQHLEYKKSLESIGFGLDSLRSIQGAAVKFDSNPDTVLTAIDTYLTLTNLTAELDRVRGLVTSEEEQLSTLNTDVTTLRTRQTELQTTINENQNTIQQLNRTIELGYNLESLRNLEQQTRKFKGIENFLTALAKYDNLVALEQDVSKAQENIDTLAANKTKMEADNVQYKTEIDITRKLITEHKLGLQALQELLQLCVKYGAPEEVIRAIGSYDNLKTLESNVETLQNKLAELEKKEEQLNEKLDMHLPEIEKTLLDIDTQLKKDVNTTKTQLKTDLDEVLKAVHESSLAYQEFIDRAKENAPYMELLELTKDPKSVTNSRILDTIECIMKQLQKWISINDLVFKYPVKAKYDLLPKVEAFTRELEKTERLR
jgi:chromosome segregation ATPase